MLNISHAVKVQVDEKRKLIQEMEFRLCHGGFIQIEGAYKGKRASFEDMMTETNNLLDLTMPIKKYPNANNHQNLY